MSTTNTPLVLDGPNPFTETLTLPEPGQSLNQTTRKLKTTDVSTKGLKVKQMKELLKAYGLPVSGKREMLLQRLREYAADPAQWNTQFLPARGLERGSISKRRAVNSHAARRIIAQFGDKDPQVEFLPRRTGGDFAPVAQPLTESKKAASSAWVQKVLARQTVQLNRDGNKTSTLEPSGDVGTSGANPGETLAVAGVGERGDSESQNVEARGVGFGMIPDKSQGITNFRRLERRVVELNRGVMSELGEVKAQLTSMHRAFSDPARRLSSPPPSTTHLALSHRVLPLSSAHSHSQTPSPSSLQTMSASTQGDSEHNPTVHLPRSVLASTSNASRSFVPPADFEGGNGGASLAPMHTPPTYAAHSCHADLSTGTPALPVKASESNEMFFELDGKRVAFDKTAVPNPPSVSFADDLSQLFREWHKSDLLTVSGHGIPVKHWVWFYGKRTNIKPFAWDVIRARWHNWKDLVAERERFPSEDAFWAAHSDADGKRLNQQAILTRIRSVRGHDDKHDAAMALKFFNNDLTDSRAKGIFLYRKNSVVYVCQSPQGIARKWRKLLARDAEIAQAAEEMEDSEHDLTPTDTAISA